jgi:hypothetical protein
MDLIDVNFVINTLLKKEVYLQISIIRKKLPKKRPELVFITVF